MSEASVKRGMGRGWRNGLGVAAVLVIAVVGWRMFFSAEAILSRAVGSFGVERLREWAARAVQEARPEDNETAVLVIHSDLPPEIRALGGGPAFARLVPAGSLHPWFVRLEFGGGFHHYGLFIGPPGMSAGASEAHSETQLADGIWLYSEH